jgi:hypothetical protein
MRACHGEFGRPERRTADPPLRYAPPGFPVEPGGLGVLHAAFLNESSTRGLYDLANDSVAALQDNLLDRAFV